MNANETKTTNETLKNEMLRMARVATERYYEAKVKFTADFETNPASAIEWLAGPMAEAQAKYETWMVAERELAKHDAMDVLDETIQAVEQKIDGFFGSNSTCRFTNAVARARVEANRKLLGNLRSLRRTAKDFAATTK